MPGADLKTLLKRAVEIVMPNLREYYRMVRKGRIVATHPSEGGRAHHPGRQRAVFRSWRFCRHGGLQGAYVPGRKLHPLGEVDVYGIGSDRRYFHRRKSGHRRQQQSGVQVGGGYEYFNLQTHNN